MAVSLKKQVFSSMKWNTLSVIVNVLVQILRISVLARFLDRGDFGMIAIALMVVSFTEIFADLGFTVPLIHKQNISRDEYSSIFWINILLSIFISLILILSAPLIAHFYNTIQLIPIIRVLSLVVVLNALGKVFQTIKQKELEYKFISVVSIISNIVGFGIMIILAIKGYGIWSLVFGTIIMTGLRQGIYFFVGIKNSKIRFYCSIIKIRDFIKIGGFQMGSQIMDFVASKIDIFILGKTIGIDNLGVYNLAKELIIKCYALSNSLTRGVMSAAFAKIQYDIVKLKITYLKFCRINSCMFVPVFALMFLFSDDVSILMYGDKWDTIYQVLSILSIYGAFSVIIAPLASILISLGRTEYSLNWSIAQMFISAVCVLILGKFGFISVVYSQVLISIILFFMSWIFIIRKILPISLFEYIKYLTLPIADCTLIVVILNIIRGLFETSIIIDAVLCATFIFIYICILGYRYPNIKCSVIRILRNHNYDN